MHSCDKGQSYVWDVLWPENDSGPRMQWSVWQNAIIPGISLVENPTIDDETVDEVTDWSEWKLVFRQTADMYKPTTDWLSFGSCELGENYSILGELESLRGADGTFEFLMVWPSREFPNYQHWSQTSNPLDHTEEV